MKKGRKNEKENFCTVTDTLHDTDIDACSGMGSRAAAVSMPCAALGASATASAAPDSTNKP